MMSVTKKEAAWHPYDPIPLVSLDPCFLHWVLPPVQILGCIAATPFLGTAK